MTNQDSQTYLTSFDDFCAQLAIYQNNNQPVTVTPAKTMVKRKIKTKKSEPNTCVVVSHIAHHPLVQVAKEHYDHFVTHTMKGTPHGLTHSSFSIIYTDEYYELPRQEHPTATEVYKNTGVYDQDHRVRALLVATYKNMLRTSNVPYLNRSQKDKLNVAHNAYCKITYDARGYEDDRLANLHCAEEWSQRLTRAYHTVNPTLKTEAQRTTIKLPSEQSSLVPSSHADVDHTKRSELLSPHTSLGNTDTGTTGMFFAWKDSPALRELQETNHGVIVKQPDGSILKSSHIGILDIPTIGPTTAHIFPTLVGSLISISVLADLGLTAIYSDKFVIIKQGEREVLRGNRDRKTGLWMIDLALFTQTHTASLAIQVHTQADVAAFWHGTFGSPSLSTFTRAIDKNFIKLPGVTAKLMRKHFPNPLATSFGHLDQTR